MTHPAVEPSVNMATCTAGTLRQNRLSLRQTFAFQVPNEVRPPRGCDAACLDHLQRVPVHRLSAFVRVSP